MIVFQKYVKNLKKIHSYYVFVQCMQRCSKAKKTGLIHQILLTLKLHVKISIAVFKFECKLVQDQ